MAAGAAAISFPISLSSPFQPTCRRAPPPSCTHSERGVSFDSGSAFYRSDSATGRDLAVLAATLNRGGRSDPAAPFLCLDAMCGCGVRALRYLAQAGADFVWANDASEALRPVIVGNLSRFEDREAAAEAGRRRWVVSHNDATRLLAERYLRREYFDVIDVDSFGGDSAYVRAAILALKIGGLLYLTSTDWRSARGYGSRSENGVTLEKVLSTMIEESDPRLPPGYIRLDEISHRAKVNSPPLGTLINSLRQEGFAACRSHIGINAIKTNSPMISCIDAARGIRNAPAMPITPLVSTK